MPFHTGAISADSHVVEPPDLWLRRIEPAYRDRAPHVKTTPAGDVFVCEGATLIPVGLVGAAGRAQDEVSIPGTYEKDAHRGGYDPDARVQEMEADGIVAEVLYPSVTARMFEIEDQGFQQACLRAYNSWLADYCAAHPDRFRGVAQIWVHDAPSAVAEIERCAKLGLAGVGVPVTTGQLQRYSEPDMDPIWSAATAAGMPVSLHVASSTNKPMGLSPLQGIIAQSYNCMEPMQSVAAMIFGGVFLRHPAMRVVVAEYELSWAAYFTQRMDLLFDRRRKTNPLPHLPRDMVPSEQFLSHVHMAFMRDAPGIRIRDDIGAQNIMFSTDYPHIDSTYPNTAQHIESLCGALPAADAERIIRGNAARLYNFP